MLRFKQFLLKYANVCPKTGKIVSFKETGSKLLFPIFGLLSLTWFIVRVIPKPSRLGYPCMKVAAPIASGFIAYVVGLAATVFAFQKARKQFKDARYVLAGVFLLFGLTAGIFWTNNTSKTVVAASQEHLSNQPMGEAKGIFPGRVVWAYNPDATDENCDPSEYGHGWFLSENNDQVVIDQMLSDAIQTLTETETDAAAWDAIFKYHNNQRGKGEVGYQAGEIVFIKINVTSSWNGNFQTSDLSKTNNQWYGISETSPQLVLSALRQLVNVIGVNQTDIYVGDPMKHIYKHCYDLWHNEFPNVHYLDHDGYTNLGREKVVKSTTAEIKYSDRGAVLHASGWNPTPVTQDYFYTIFKEMEYMLNIPTLKGHKHACITMFAKNHFGSHTRDDAQHLHPGLIDPQDGTPVRDQYGMYRVQVDLLGHELLGGKTLVYLMDALWTSDYEIDEPDKWEMAPFNNDWTSSIFISQDPVAIESVGFDFLRTEFDGTNGLASYPNMVQAVDDYLHQAADEANWPEGITYDPEEDGIKLNSLGVHEHWNNATDMKYSRNLGTGNGVELVRTGAATGCEDCSDLLSRTVSDYKLYSNYPNPFNPSTTIRYEIAFPSRVRLSVYNMKGQAVKTLVNEFQSAGEYAVQWNGQFENGTSVPSGVYIYQIDIDNGRNVNRSTQRMVLLK